MAQRGRGSTGSGPGRGGRPARRPSGTAGRAAPAAGRAPRPGAKARTRRTRAPRPRGRFTGRAVVLALVLLALVLSYAYPVRTYLDQRAQIAALERSQSAQRQRIARLAAERAKWNDPKYVEAQAREHLQMARPGDKVYTVYDDPGIGKKKHRDGSTVRSTGPWYGKLWSSVQSADGPAH
jgi:cell division protein FtsL